MKISTIILTITFISTALYLAYLKQEQTPFLSEANPLYPQPMNGYSVQDAKDLLYYSKAAYCDINSLQSWSCGQSCDYHKNMKDVSVYLNTSHSAQGFAGYNADTNRIVVAFRGTNDDINWWNDFKALQTTYPYCSGCMVHLGFYETYNDIGSKLLTAVSALRSKYGQLPIVVSGHSLGGALAQLFAADQKRFGFQVDYIYTFGSPRVGNTPFSAWVYQTVNNQQRVVHYRDPVPHVPFESIVGIEYNHIPTEVWYNVEDSSTFKVCPPTSGVKENQSCANTISVFYISDHTTYLGLCTGCTC